MAILLADHAVTRPMRISALFHVYVLSVFREDNGFPLRFTGGRGQSRKSLVSPREDFPKGFTDDIDHGRKDEFYMVGIALGAGPPQTKIVASIVTGLIDLAIGRQGENFIDPFRRGAKDRSYRCNQHVTRIG